MHSLGASFLLKSLIKKSDPGSYAILHYFQSGYHNNNYSEKIYPEKTLHSLGERFPFKSLIKKSLTLDHMQFCIISKMGLMIIILKKNRPRKTLHSLGESLPLKSLIKKSDPGSYAILHYFQSGYHNNNYF